MVPAVFPHAQEEAVQWFPKTFAYYRSPVVDGFQSAKLNCEQWTSRSANSGFAGVKGGVGGQS